MPEMAGILAYSSVFLTLALVSGIACLGLNLQWGQTGLFNAGVAGFVAIGAYTSALLTTAPVDGRLGGYGWPIAAGCLGGMLSAAGASAVVGMVTLRLRADYLAMTTFGAAVAIELVLRNAERLTGGTFGIGFIPRPFGALAAEPLPFALASLGLVGVVVLIAFMALESLLRSPWGRVLRAVREDEGAACALGKNAPRIRLQAFALGGALMGLSGALEAHLIGYIAPNNFDASLTFQLWTMLILGGAGNNAGALLGALLVSALWSASGLATGIFFPPEDQARAGALRIVGIGVLLAATVVLRPRGLLGERLTVSRHVSARRQTAPETAARAEHERLAAVLDAISDEVWFVDPTGSVTLANRTALQTFGYASPRDVNMRELIANVVVTRVDGTPRPRDAAPPFRALAGYTVRDEEEIVVMPGSGERRHRLVSAAPVRDASGAIVGSVSVVRDITALIGERRAAMERLRALNSELEHQVLDRTARLRERDAMLQEIHHRVKNNLQVISSLINMQIRPIIGAPASLALQECRSRVETMAEIHAMLYQSGDYGRLPFAQYAKDLASRVMSSTGVSPERVAIEFECEDVGLSVDKAIPCGLILNELVSNALKHAFPDPRHGRIRVSLKRMTADIVQLSVSDNGCGIPVDFNPHESRTLGIQLVVSLVRQLDGALDIERQGGSRFLITFPAEV